MKIRTDFVTNSSSSSFVTFSIRNKELAEICKKYNIPVSTWGGTVGATWYSEDSLYDHYPSDGNVALWFAELLTGDFDRIAYGDANVAEARAEITAKAAQLSSNTEFSTIEICEIDTEGTGSSYFCQEKEDGIVKTTSVDEDDWECDDEDRALWQVLSEEDFNSVVEYAEKHGFVSEQADKYSFSPNVSTEYKKSYNVELVGTGKDGRAPNHEYMSTGDKVELVREPNNPYDSNAILIQGKGRGLGHIPAYIATDIAWQLDSDKFAVANAKVVSVTPLSQRSKNAKNPLMTISFDIVAAATVSEGDTEGTISKKNKNSSKSVKSKKTTTDKKKSSKAKSLSAKQLKESAFANFFETMVDYFNDEDVAKEVVKEHFYDNYHGCLFLWLFFRWGVNESGLEAQELTDIVKCEEFRSVLGITMIEIGIVTQIESLVNELLESEDEDDVAKTLLSSALMTAVAEKELYIEFANNLEKVFSELSTSMDAMRNQFDEFEQLFEEMVSDILDTSDDEDDDIDEYYDDDEDDFDPVVAEQAKAEIIDSLEDIKKSLEALGQQAQAMAEEARQREQAEIDEATKRGKYIPIEFKPNNIFPEGFVEFLEQGKPYPKYYEHDFETFVRRIKEIIPVDISDVPEDVLYKHEGRYTIDHVEYPAGRIVDLWNKYLLSLKGIETDFSVWQIEKWGIGFCDDIDKLIFELDDKFWLNGFVSEDEDFEFDKGILKKYNGKASNIVLPEGIIQFASSKFYNTNKDISNVTSFTFPRTLKKFDTQSETPFPKMRNLTRIDVSDNNEIFSSVNGALLNKTGTELLYYPIAKRDKEYTLPKTVIKVLPNVFTKNRYVEKIIVPGNVVEIGEGAFSNCINLKSVIFENGVKTIAKNAFKGCSSLEEIFIPESMEKFLMTSFQKCENLKNIYVSENSKVMVNAEKMATKFGAKLVKYKTGESFDDVLKKQKATNLSPTINVAINATENNATSAHVVKQSVEVKAKPVVPQKKEEKTSNDLVLKDKADKRIKELEEQIKSNNDSSTFGSMIIVGGLLLAAFFLYCVIDEYNAYQVSSAFYNYVSTDSITISFVLLAISLIIVVFGFVKKCKGKKANAINSQLQNEINILKDAKNHKLYFENEEKSTKAKDNKKIDTKKN